MTTQKERGLRYSSNCLKAISDANRDAALRFIDWKVGRDRVGSVRVPQVSTAGIPFQASCAG